MRDRSYWLPPGGIGNGLDAQTRAALVDADASQLILPLDELREAGIAAYASADWAAGRPRPPSGSGWTPGRTPAQKTWCAGYCCATGRPGHDRAESPG
jgi:hypothetical protein